MDKEIEFIAVGNSYLPIDKTMVADGMRVLGRDVKYCHNRTPSKPIVFHDSGSRCWVFKNTFSCQWDKKDEPTCAGCRFINMDESTARAEAYAHWAKWIEQNKLRILLGSNKAKLDEVLAMIAEAQAAQTST